MTGAAVEGATTIGVSLQGGAVVRTHVGFVVGAAVVGALVIGVAAMRVPVGVFIAGLQGWH